MVGVSLATKAPGFPRPRGKCPKDKGGTRPLRFSVRGRAKAKRPAQGMPEGQDGGASGLPLAGERQSQSGLPHVTSAKREIRWTTQTG